MRTSEEFELGIVSTTVPLLPGDLPAFDFNDSTPGMLVNLPDPGVPCGISFKSAAVNDAPLKGIAKMSSLIWLELGRSRVTELSLEEVGQLTGLRTLIFDFCPLSDAGVACLSGLKNLEVLTLRDAKVTNARHESPRRDDKSPSIPTPVHRRHDG